MSRPPPPADTVRGADEVKDGDLELSRAAVRYAHEGPVRWRPPGNGSLAAAPAVLAVHGYGMAPGSMAAFVAPFVPDTAWLLVPEGPSTFYRRARPQGSSRSGIGHGWIADPRRDLTDARNDALLAATLEGAHATHPVDPARTWLVAFSQGVGVACHFACTHPDRVAGIVGLAGGVPRAQRPRLAALAGKPVLWISGTRDTSYPPDYVADVVRAWQDAGADLTHHALDAGHMLLPQAAPLVDAWLSPRLR